MSLCVEGDCLERALFDGRCAKHAPVSPSAWLAIRSEERLQRETEDRQRRSKKTAGAAASFAVAGSAILLGLGAGALGVVAVSGVIAGIYFLFSE